MVHCSDIVTLVPGVIGIKLPWIHSEESISFSQLLGGLLGQQLSLLSDRLQPVLLDLDLYFLAAAWGVMLQLNSN